MNLRINKWIVTCIMSVAIVGNGVAQNSRTDKVQTYVMENPYPVEKIVPPTGTKVKNVILMIGDGMSLMHVYSAWTANRGKLYLENCEVTGLSKTYCANKLRGRRNGHGDWAEDQLSLSWSRCERESSAFFDQTG